MTDYVKATNFAAKDALPSGDANKKVRGTEINDELTSIQTAIATKLDRASPNMTGTPLAPSPSLAADNTQIATTEWVRDLLNAYEPLGTIKAWAGSVGSLPTGWALCNGASGTLNLTDRFIAGFGGGVFGQNGTAGYAPGSFSVPVSGTIDANGAHNHGSSTAFHALTVAEMPSHNHGVTLTTGIGSTGYYSGNNFGLEVTTVSAGSNSGHRHTISNDGGHQHAFSGSVAVPGFYTLAFIQKIALL
jgi:microcystin-dependent protein